MLRLEDTDTQALLRSSARDFVTKECSLAYVNELEGATGRPDALWRKVVDLGWTSLLVPGDFDGLEGGIDEAAALCEEMGRGLVPGPFLSSAVMSTLILRDNATSELVGDTLSALAAGELTCTFAFAEEGYDWTPAAVQLQGEQSGDGFTLHGVKQFVPDAGESARIICVARTGNAPDALTTFLIDTTAPGITVRRMHGWTRQPVFEVSFDGVRASASQIIGERDGGWRACSPAIDIATVLLCAYLYGAMEQTYEMTMVYAHQRVQFGQAIARFQRVQDHLINMRSWTDASGLAMREAIGVIIDGDGDVARAASLAKEVTSRGFYHLCDAAHHVHGGVGSDKSYGLHLFTQASRGYYHYLGSPEHHRERLASLLGF